MGKLGYFLGGALLGAAGLSAAVLLTQNKEDAAEPHVNFTPDEASRMDAQEVIEHLDAYFSQSCGLGIQSSLSCFDCGDLSSGSIHLPDDGLFTKVENRLVDALVCVGRKSKEQDLRLARQRIEGLYQRYRPVFVRANRLLSAQGVSGVSLKDFTLADHEFSLKNSIDNENWCDEALDLNSCLDDFISKTTEAANKLVSRLKHLAGHTVPLPACA